MTALTETEAAPICGQAGMLPVAALAVAEEPGSGPRETVADGHATVIQAVEGVVYVTAGDDDWVLTAGDAAAIAPGMPYRRWNAGDTRARWVELYCAAYA